MRHVADGELTGAPDAKLIDVCRSEQRMLVTFDIGFGDIRIYPPAEHGGIVLLRLRDQMPRSTLDRQGNPEAPTRDALSDQTAA